jgi:hypothetical protein
MAPATYSRMATTFGVLDMWCSLLVSVEETLAGSTMRPVEPDEWD